MYFNNSPTGFLKCVRFHDTVYRNTRCNLNQGRFQMIAAYRAANGDKVFLTLSSSNSTSRWCTGIGQSFRTGQRGLDGRLRLVSFVSPTGNSATSNSWSVVQSLNDCSCGQTGRQGKTWPFPGSRHLSPVLHRLDSALQRVGPIHPLNNYGLVN